MQNDIEERLSQIKQRCQSSSPAPWSNSLGGGYHVHGVGGKWICATDNKEWGSRGPISSKRREQAISNADFIAHAREDIEWLLAEYERLLTKRAADLPYSDEIMCLHDRIEKWCPECHPESASR